MIICVSLFKKKMTFNIADKVNSKPSSKKMYSSREQLQTVKDFKSETTNVKDTLSTLSLFSETSGFAIKENFSKKGKLSMTYLVAGVGFVVSVLLILIVIQLCRKHGYAKRKALTKNQTVNKPDVGLTNQTPSKIIKHTWNLPPSNNRIICIWTPYIMNSMSVQRRWRSQRTQTQ